MKSSNSRGLLYWLVLIIAIATVLSGVVQVADPEFVLRIVSAEATKTSEHFFGIIGMFMALFGGMLTQTLFSGDQPPIVFLWTALQKFGASAAVAIGVMRHVFSSLALGISAFDLLSAILLCVYLSSLRSRQIV